MSRIPPLEPDEQTEEQREIGAAIADARGTVGGPFALWLRVPEIARRGHQFSERVRLQSTIEGRLFELMVVVVARHWSASYEWSVHAAAARRRGVSPEVVEAIGLRRTPPFARDDERIVYDTVTELMTTRALSPASYERALALFGRERLIEFVTAVGWYAMLALVLNAFDVAPAEGEPLP